MKAVFDFTVFVHSRSCPPQPPMTRIYLIPVSAGPFALVATSAAFRIAAARPRRTSALPTRATFK